MSHDTDLESGVGRDGHSMVPGYRYQGGLDQPGFGRDDNPHEKGQAGEGGTQWPYTADHTVRAGRNGRPAVSRDAEPRGLEPVDPIICRGVANASCRFIIMRTLFFLVLVT